MDQLARPRKFRAYDRKSFDAIPQLEGLPPERREEMRIVAEVLPFRVNDYVLEELIDWSRVPDDPMFQLTFPQRDMLAPEDFDALRELVRGGAPVGAVRAKARAIQLGMNPHPAGQMELNVPSVGGARLAGVQHKYRETVLFFPAQGQTCHAYCTYCFRWPQFVGLEDLKFAAREADELVAYLLEHPEVSNVLITGGDPMIMRTALLERYIEPLLALPQLASIRIGTKAPAYWPHRFTTDADADSLARLFERVVAAGKHLAVMAHFSHPRELETGAVRTALTRIRSTGAVVRCQAPLIRHVNDDAAVWATMWRTQVQLGAVPYYMFVERDTGPRGYFEVPLARAVDIFQGAVSKVSGLARTVRGPSMSSTWGKVVVDGVVEVGAERAFVLRYLQARDPSWVGQPFFARFDPRATWVDQLEPALGEKRFCFDPELVRKQKKLAREASKKRHLLLVATGAGDGEAA